MSDVPQVPASLDERRRAVSGVVKAVLARWLEPGYHPRVATAWCITQGPCVDFAEEVLAAVEERFPGIEAEMVHSDEALAARGFESGNYHAFVRIEGLHYDSQQTDGVADPFHLPFMARELTMARIFADRDGGHDDADEEPCPRP